MGFFYEYGFGFGPRRLDLPFIPDGVIHISFQLVKLLLLIMLHLRPDGLDRTVVLAGKPSGLALGRLDGSHGAGGEGAVLGSDSDSQAMCWLHHDLQSSGGTACS